MPRVSFETGLRVSSSAGSAMHAAMPTSGDLRKQSRPPCGPSALRLRSRFVLGSGPTQSCGRRRAGLKGHCHALPKSMLPEATADGEELSGYALARRMDATACAACCCLCVLIKRVRLLDAFSALGAACGFLLRALGAAAGPRRRLRALCGGRSTRRRFPWRLPRRFPPPFSTSTAVLHCFCFFGAFALPLTSMPAPIASWVI